MYRLKIDFYTPSFPFFWVFEASSALVLTFGYPTIQQNRRAPEHRASATAASCLRISETLRWGATRDSELGCVACDGYATRNGR